jgi:hypothetical protein
MDAYHLYTDAFIIRIWRETREISNTMSKWRGVVEAVGSQERIYFESFTKMLEFIRERIGPEAAAALSEQVEGNGR